MILTSLRPPLVSYPYEVNSFITRPHPPSLSMDQTELFRAMVKAVRLRMKAQRRESGSLSDSFLLTKSTRKTTLFATQARDVVSLLCFIMYILNKLLPFFFVYNLGCDWGACGRGGLGAAWFGAAFMFLIFYTLFNCINILMEALLALARPYGQTRTEELSSWKFFNRGKTYLAPSILTF